MTYKEWMLIKNPSMVNDIYEGGVNGCPHLYGLEPLDNMPCDYAFSCNECWNRNMMSYIVMVTGKPITEEIILKLGDNAYDYLYKGYKCYVPNDLIINGNTGFVVRKEEVL
jgi:hypothetical protein